MLPSFNWEVNITTALALLTAAGTIASFYFGTSNDLKGLKEAMKEGMSKLDANVEKMNKVVMDLALSTQRQDNFEKRHDADIAALKEDIRDMKHLKGFIKEPL